MTLNVDILVKTFEKIFDSLKRGVTLHRVTSTKSNITGSEEKVYGSAEAVELPTTKTSVKFAWMPEGLIEQGDIQLFDKPNNLNMKRFDKIIMDGEDFEIRSVIHWVVQGVSVYDYMVGYKI